MELIQRLPFTLSALTAIIIGIISYKYNVAIKDAYFRMAIGMITTFVLGVYIRGTLENILEEIERKRKEQEEQEEMERLQQLEEIKKQENIAKGNAAAKPLFDLKVDDSFGEEFTPLTVSEIMSANIKE